MPQLGPRLVIAGTSSGVGKTTVATGLMAALTRRGLVVASAKVGPDFIDPGYHALATGRPGRNLDAWICGSEAIVPLAARGALGADISVVEGVMGLFDGAFEPPVASTAQVATLLSAPVVLVVDAAATGASVAALVHGFATFDNSIRPAALILNRVGSDSHEALLRQALAPVGIPVLGVLRRHNRLSWRSRHLGLVPVVENPAAIADGIQHLAGLMDDGCDLAALINLAESAPPQSVSFPPRPEPLAGSGPPVRLAVAGGAAFSFMYPENLEALSDAGTELAWFDPITEEHLPERIDGLIAGGGFPEVHAEALAANQPLLGQVRTAVTGGLVTWAECGGLLWLSQALDGHPLAGAIPATAALTDRLTLGYRRGVFATANPLGPAGTPFRGHEFHYSQIQPPGDALCWHGRTGPGIGGFATPSLLASYVHLHLGAAPRLAEHLVATAFGSRDRHRSG